MNIAPESPQQNLISSKEFETVAELLKTMTGIHISANKQAMVAGRLSKRLKAINVSSVAAYCELLIAPGSDSERDAFISALTTNMTRFYREPHHFKHFEEHILPNLVNTARKGGRVRIWSAGCSMGEEPYDLACHILDACPDAARLDIKILATDIDKTALATAVKGEYSTASLENLPKDYGHRFFEDVPNDAGFSRVQHAPRDIITFRALNLNAEWPFKGEFDVIMCRNVAIYFDAPTQASLWQRMVQRLRATGALYIGHSEALPRHVAEGVRQEGIGTFRLPKSQVPSPLRKSDIPRNLEANQ